MNLSINIALDIKNNSDDQLCPSDSIIKGCIQQNRKAQEQLYKKYFGKMMATAMRYLNNQEDSLEAVNSGFLKIFQQIQQYNGQGSFEGWMYHIVRNTIIDMQRKKIKYTSMEGISIDESYHTLHTSIDDNLHASDLMKMLKQLPEATRMVFNLFAIEGFKHQEIAALLQITEGTSKWHVNSARKLLQAAIEKLERNHL